MDRTAAIRDNLALDAAANRRTVRFPTISSGNILRRPTSKERPKMSAGSSTAERAISTTERPEIIDVGGGKLVGANRDRILAEASRLLSDAAAYRSMSSAINPFGDGHAAKRIVAALAAAW